MKLLQVLLKLLLQESIFEILVMAIFFVITQLKISCDILLLQLVLYSNNPGLCITVLQLMEKMFEKKHLKYI